MRLRRPLLVSIIASVATLLVLVLVLPWLFRDRIAARIRSAVNESVTARVDWRSAGVDHWHDFPNLTLSIGGLSVATAAPFSGDTLAQLSDARLSLDLSSVIG